MGNVQKKCWERMAEEEERGDSVGVTRRREGGGLNFLTGFDDNVVMLHEKERSEMRMGNLFK